MQVLVPEHLLHGVPVIYAITNTVNGKRYVGSSKSLFERLKGHKEAPPNPHLKNAFNYYGLEKFSIEVIEALSSEEQLKPREIYWIGFLRTYDPKIGYNKKYGDEVTGRWRYPEEVKEKIRAARARQVIDPEAMRRAHEKLRGQKRSQLAKNLMSLRAKQRGAWRNFQTPEARANAQTSRKASYPHHSEETKDLIQHSQPTCKPVLQFTKDGEFIAEYPSLSEAGRALGSTNYMMPIRQCCQLKANSAQGFVWRFVEDCEKGVQGIWRPQGLTRPKPIKGIPRKVEQVDPATGAIVAVHPSIVAAVKALGLSHGTCIADTCRGLQPSAYGFGWRYGEIEKKVVTSTTKQKLRNANLGKPVSEATRRKISEAGKGRVHTEETKQKIPVAHLGKAVSDEARQKMSQARKRSVEQVDPTTGKVIATFACAKDAAAVVGLKDFCFIGDVCRAPFGTRRAKGSFWRYASHTIPV